MRLVPFLMVVMIVSLTYVKPTSSFSESNSIAPMQRQYSSVACQVYPLTFDETLINNVEELGTTGSTHSEIYQSYANSIFRVPSVNGQFDFATWGNESSSITAEHYWNNGGSLLEFYQGQNSILEIDDFLHKHFDTEALGLQAIFDQFIQDQETMILPLYDVIEPNPSRYHVSRFVTVRLLDYHLTGTSEDYLEFSLVDADSFYSCFQAPQQTTIYEQVTVSVVVPQNQGLMYTLYWGDGSSTTDLQATHTYQYPGTYTLRLTVQDSHGSMTEKIMPITISTQNNADCHVYPITFHESEINSVLELPDPTLDPEDIVLMYPETIFTISSLDFDMFITWNPGSASLESFAGAGNLSYGFQEGPYIPDLPFEPTSPNQLLEATDIVAGTVFTPSSVKPYLDYHINNKTVMILPLHAISSGIGSSQRYQVTFFIAVRLLDYNFSTDTYNLTFALIEDRAPYACFRTPEYVFAGEPAAMTPLTPLNQESAHIWHWGDGTTSSTREATHIYTEPGTYSVTLSTTTTNHFTAQAFGSVTVEDPVALDLISTTPDALGSVSTITTTLADFADSARVLTYTVNWGDYSPLEAFIITAATITSIPLTHVYTSTGMYTPSITIISPNQAMLQRSIPISVYNPTAINLQAAQVNLATWNFTATVTGTAPFSYTWNWGDGSEPLVTSSPSATHTFAQAGTYTVTLTVTDANGWQVEQDYVVEVVLQRVFLPMLRR